MEKFFRYLLPITCWVFIGCSEKSESTPSIDCTVTLDATYTGGMFFVDVAATVPWQAATDVDWLTLSAVIGPAGTSVLSVDVSQHLSVASRQGEIVLSNTEYSVVRKIAVRQTGLSQSDLKQFTMVYTTNDNSPLRFGADAFDDANIVEHEYANGAGVLTFDKPVTRIGKAFYYCGNLTSVTMPNGILSIGKNAFYWCTNLSSVTIPDSVTSIGMEAFISCSSLAEIIIPEGVTAIGEAAFYFCHSMTDFYCKPQVPPVLGGSSNVFFVGLPRIYVPRASVEAYKTAKGWKQYADKIAGYDF